MIFNFMFWLFWPPFKMNSERNDTLLSPDIKVLELGLKVGYPLGWTKSPRIAPSSPPHKSMNFGDFPSLNPRILGCPRPRSIPRIWRECIPVPFPKICGFSRICPRFPPIYIHNRGFPGDPWYFALRSLTKNSSVKFSLTPSNPKKLVFHQSLLLWMF